MSSKRLKRDHLYAAEIFGYSFANYRDHLGIGHVRFEKLMPKDAHMLRRAAKEGWPLKKIAEELGTDPDNAAALLTAAQMAIEVLETGSPAESFRKAIRQVVSHAVHQGFDEPDAIEKLVTQICYRVSDLSCLLDIEDEQLSDYCEELRQEPDDVEFDDDEVI